MHGIVRLRSDQAESSLVLKNTYYVNVSKYILDKLYHYFRNSMMQMNYDW